MKTKLFLFLIISLLSSQLYAQKGFPFDNEIHAFKQLDSLNMPKPGGILFVGSSSIRLWDDLEQRYAGKPIIKRGVGGSELWQWVQYFPQYLIYPYKPKKVFIYAGENDIASGRSAEDVAGNFEKLWEMIRKELPATEIYFLSIKPSPSRAKFYAVVAAANSLIKTSVAKKPKTKYIDVASTILDPKTQLPDSSLFKPDYLHLKSTGYDRWQTVLNKYVK
ncbi:SGNH/GDSL hydrolase family protein [Mucilaginibacter gynuensis]|uniref:SGNH/GDSL hydrolase family protein n=1 Tax=Mucilaginibacter gynuensis TaxID=1302236 RepID=A0ABP8GU74_9SPHI